MAGTTIETSVPQPNLSDVLPDDDGSDLNGGDAEIEARARAMGWHPLAEFRGRAGTWRPASEFLARAETEAPITRDNLRRMTDKVMRIEGEMTSLRSTANEQLQIIKDLREMGRKQNQAGYERAMAEIRSKQRQAVERGDTGAYDQLVEQAEALASERPAAELPKAVVEPQRPAAPAMSEPTRQFFAANPWFNRDKLLADTMIHFHQQVLNERQATQEMLNADPELDRELRGGSKGQSG